MSYETRVLWEEEVTDEEGAYRRSRRYLFSFNKRFAAAVDHGVEVTRLARGQITLTERVGLRAKKASQVPNRRMETRLIVTSAIHLRKRRTQ